MSRTVTVIAGLDPAIHPLRKKLPAKMMDTRVKPAYDAVFVVWRVKPRMTS
jgi:hypothetical protein